MAENERDASSVVLARATHPFDIETPRSEFSNDENSPLSPGEVRIMRNHPKVASVLFSPSRKSLGDGKIKPKSFTSSLYASPSRKTKLSGVEKEKRKTLQVLQPTASGDGTLVGSRGVIKQHETKPKKNKTAMLKLKQQKLKIPSSGSSSSTTCTDSSDSDTAGNSLKKSPKALQNDVNKEAMALMISDPPPERYWELLAEERRLALQEALEENEKLHKQLAEMRERNKALEEVAGQAEYFASLYQMVMEGEVRETELSGASDDESLVVASLKARGKGERE